MSFGFLFTPYFFMTLLLAFVQSATEFLPVSSSAHLILCQSFGFTDRGIFSDVAMHAGTLLAVIIYFKKDLWCMFKNMLKGGDDTRLMRNLIIATIPILISGVVGITIISRLRSPIVIGGTSIIFGFILWVTDKISFTGTNSDLRTMTIWDALCIGLAQLLALVPGVSRSGICITCCRALGFNRRESTRFAMLLSIPTISAASVYIFLLAHRDHLLNQLLTFNVLLGTFLSAILGLIVIKFLMAWIKHASFAVFALYRIALGIFVLNYFLF
ncbi:MAG: undecaprenyl-diphosphate phosphatase [Alphaproteobacteria bacterium]|nr:undecaprenyl-diphosphate phosphatase [Alphaproteobacteria bacterium]